MILWRTVFVLLMFVASLRAEEAKNPLQVTLLCDHSQIRAGEGATLGLLLQHPAGYHTYWKHPGVVGIATQAKWKLPPGFHTDTMLWPAPQKVMMSIHPAQGYKTDTLLLVPLRVDPDVAAGDYRIDVTLDWMCCAKGCFPGHAVPFSITCHIGSTAVIDPANAPLFAKHRATVPQPTKDWKATFRAEEKRIVLELRPQGEQARAIEELGELWFFSADGAVDSSTPQKVTRFADRVTMEFTRFSFGPKDVTHLPGVLHASQGWDKAGKSSYIEIDAAE